MTCKNQTMFFEALKDAGVDLEELKGKPQGQSAIIEAQLQLDNNTRQQYDSNNHSSFDRHYENARMVEIKDMEEAEAEAQEATINPPPSP